MESILSAGNRSKRYFYVCPREEQSSLISSRISALGVHDSEHPQSHEGVIPGEEVNQEMLLP